MLRRYTQEEAKSDVVERYGGSIKRSLQRVLDGIGPDLMLPLSRTRSFLTKNFISCSWTEVISYYVIKNGNISVVIDPKPVRLPVCEEGPSDRLNCIADPAGIFLEGIDSF